MVWTDLHDEMLCREIIGVDVFTGAKKGTVKRSEKWAMVVENLSAVECLHFKVDKRAVRDRYNLLQSNYRRKVKQEEKASGVAVEMSEVERALEFIMEKEDAAQELRQEGKLKKVADEADKVNAGYIRKKAVERFGETQKRKSAESGIAPTRKKRSNGSDTVRYLKEKHEQMLEVEEKKLEIEKEKIEAANQRHEELMMTLQQQQQQRMEAFQVMMLQQQQQMQMQQTQQNEMMLKLFGMLNNK